MHLDTGYIENKVDFEANLSSDESNSWCEEEEMSAGDPNDDYYDEEEELSPGKKPRKRFDKDDGAGVMSLKKK